MMIEKSIAAALEPVVDEIITLEKRIAEIQLTPGPVGEAGVAGENGKDADPEVVAQLIVEKYADQLRGERGADAEQVKAVDVAIALMEHHGKALIGPAGKDADPEQVADIIFEKYADDLKGIDGANAPEVDPVEVAKALVENHIDQLKGSPGKDAEAVDVEVLKAEILSEIIVDDIIKQMADARDAQAIAEINEIFK